MAKTEKVAPIEEKKPEPPKDLQALISYLQKNLKVPKSQYNKFGEFYYRDAEDILEGVKLLLPEGSSIECEDEPVIIGDRFYIKSVVELTYMGQTRKRTASAREPLSKKGMDEMQISGAASSYARKRALDGLLAIDDTKDSDKTSKEKPPEKDKSDPSVSMAPASQEEKNEIEANALRTALNLINAAQSIDALSKLWKSHSSKWVKLPSYEEIEECKNFKKEELTNQMNGVR